MPSLIRSSFVAVSLLASLVTVAACHGQEKGSGAEALGDTVGTARRTAVVPPSRSPYRTDAVAHPGKVTGTISYTGAPSADTLVVVPADQNGCGKQLVIPTLQRRNGKLQGALVWLPDIRAGEPLPFNRRYDLTNNDCAWDPTLQVAVAGGTLNVSNYDPLVERGIITDVATRDTVAAAPFTDNGQVIPYDKLLRTPGVYEFSMESRPMSRAWVAVLDSPYYAITDANGSFAIDGVPPGTHQVRVWHPLLGVANGTVTVGPDGTATVNIAFGDTNTAPQRTGK
jgi:hypothetical protein